MWLRSNRKQRFNASISSRKVPSLRKRFIFAGTFLIGVIALITIQIVFVYSQNLADLSYDRLLRSALLQMDENVIFVNDDVSIDIPWSAFATLAQANEDRIFYRVDSSKNGFITGNEALLLNQAAPVELGEIQFFNQFFSGEMVRFALLERQVTEANKQEQIRIVLGQTRLAREKMSSNITLGAVRLILLIAVVAILLITVVSQLVLRPLREITELLEARKPGDLTPILIDTPKETQQLKHSLNHFMERLQINLEQLENFTAESAHQLRTPLASLRALAENARDQTSPETQQEALEKIVYQCETLNQTITVLLNQAVVSYRLQTQNLAPIDLVELTRQSCMDQAVMALHQGVLISFDSSVECAIVQGDSFSLQQMLNNLIDNAIRYSETTESNQQGVDICLRQESDAIVINVIDYGRGICDEEKPLVFDRFYRGRYEVSGTGVGLAIVKHIADRHQASIQIKNTEPKGATIEIIFPIFHDVF